MNTNSGRLYEFDSLDEVQCVLEMLADPEMPYVRQLPRKPGQKETRYIHLLGDPTELNEDAPGDENSTASGELEIRLAKVEEELAALKESFDKLMKELMG